MQRSAYLHNEDENHLTIWEDVNLYSIVLEFYTENDFDLCKKRIHAHHEKSRRLHKDVEFLLSKNCIFLTLTLSDNYINNSYTYIRKCIKKYLNSLSCSYLCNVDYGELNNRLHFHAIVQLDELNLNLFPYKYGAINFKRIKKSSNSLKLTHYINKLSNHALKDSAYNSRIMKKFI